MIETINRETDNGTINGKAKEREMSELKNRGSGINFAELLTIVFIVLKLLNIISWSWFWVLSPIWISCLIVVILVVILVILKKH